MTPATAWVSGAEDAQPVPSQEVLRGLGVGRGCVVAPVVVLAAPARVPTDEPVPADLEVAEAQLRGALGAVAADLRRQADEATLASLRDMLQAAGTIAADPALAAESVRLLRSGLGPATAVDRAVGQFAEVFAAAGGALAERVTDLRSVRHRVVARLLGVPEPGLPTLTGPTVVVAEDLSPADTAGVDLHHTVAIVTELGGRTSHTAIIAGQLGLPCVVQVTGVTAVTPGTRVLVDAAAGTITVAPTEDQTQEAARRQGRARRLADDLSAGATADGHPVALLANIGTAEDADRAAETVQEGVGLFRTEVLFLDRATAPTVAQQISAYRTVVRAYAGHKVVVRTLDAGADKPLAFVRTTTEENPALGVRGYRLVRTAAPLLEAQLEALGSVIAMLPAERQTDVWVMAPMIATAAEARAFALSARAAGVQRVGVMVEVPAAALSASEILAEVDFVSLGTNDLAQYTMAADRLRGELSDLLDPWQPAILALVAGTATAGAHLHKPVGVCGESAADPLMALVLVGLGVTSLSMAPAAVPAVRYALAHHTLEQCRAIAEVARGAVDAAGGRSAAAASMDAEVRDVLGLG